MSKKIIVGIIAAILILAVFVGSGNKIPRMPFIISAYDGITAGFVDIEHDYEEDAFQTVHETVLPAEATLDFTTTATDIQTATGVRAELGQPQYIGEREDWSENITVVDDIDQTNVTEKWEVHIIEMEMGVTFKTTGTGLAPITNVMFWIELEENPYSVFTLADDAIAFILEVYTVEPATFNNHQLNDVVPAAGGTTIPVTAVERADIPDWITDSGYTGQLTNFKRVKFPLKIIKMQPTNLANIRQVEGQVTFHLQMDILLFGHWKVMNQWKEYVPPDLPDVPDLLGDLIAFLMQTGWIIGGFIIMVAVLYLAPGRYKIIGPVVFVVFLMIGLGFFDTIIDQILGASG